MKNTLKNFARYLEGGVENLKSKTQEFHMRAMAGRAGEGYIDTAVKILIAVVLGALLLAGLYALFNETVLPTLTTRITEMFDYSA